MKELVCLVEVTITKANNKLTVVVKADDHDFSVAIMEYVSRVFM